MSFALQSASKVVQWARLVVLPTPVQSLFLDRIRLLLHGLLFIVGLLHHGRNLVQCAELPPQRFTFPTSIPSLTPRVLSQGLVRPQMLIDPRRVSTKISMGETDFEASMLCYVSTCFSDALSFYMANPSPRHGRATQLTLLLCHFSRSPKQRIT